jgi:hypothetical protein
MQINKPKASIMKGNAQKFIFTRYLYIKDEVKLTLLTSILNKSEKSIFWAYELYYSGFEIELFELLWKIYFDFYYTLNPAFYIYFAKKQKEWSKLAKDSVEKDKIISTIVSNLLIRPHNLDVFLLRHTVQNFDIDFEYDISQEQITVWLDNKDYLNIAELIINRCNLEQLDGFVLHIAAYFKNKNINIKVDERVKSANSTVDQKHIALANIMLMFSSLENLVMGKKLYIIVEEKEIEKYETIYSDYDSSFYSYKILPKVCIYSIDEENYLSLFALQRYSVNLYTAYNKDWEYYASFSPVWNERITKYNGTINHETKKIDFPDDDEDFDEFYNNFGYETDEQKMVTQNKSIQTIVQVRTWVKFYEEHKKNGLYIPDQEYLDEFDRVEY